MTIPYLIFTDCCDETVVINLRLDTTVFNPFNPNPWASPHTPGVYVYNGPTVTYPTSGITLETGRCYSVTYSTGGAPVLLYDEIQNQDLFQYTGKEDCAEENITDADFGQCESCIDPCYKLINCDGKAFHTITDLSAVVNTHITIDGSTDCWFVVDTPEECGGFTNEVIVTGACSDCICNCYEVTGTGTVSYVGCDNVYYTGVLVPLRTCALTVPNFDADGSGTISTSDACVDGECPAICYKLTECTSGDIIHSNSPGLFAYVGSIVSIEGHLGCYTVEIEAGDCECPIDIIVTASYVDCDACEPTVAYRLIYCDNEEQIVYTTQDLSAYVGMTIELSDPCGCYIVEEINITPPSDTTVVIVASFENCTDCQSKFYKLVSCDPADPDTYTSSDLSLYIGKVVQLVGCEKCFTVEETRFPINPVGVTVYSYHTDCVECLKDFPCRCSTIYNEGDVAATFEYIMCDGDTGVTALVPAKSRSERYCVIRWLTGTLPLYHGNCTQAAPDDPWTCPTQDYPVKSVRPGYNTPACSIEKYEKISCNFGEAYYREVVEKRYGVSNCCPQDIDKWTVKKELIELQALIDPAYTCSVTPSGCCVCSDISGCSCSTPKTCSS